MLGGQREAEEAELGRLLAQPRGDLVVLLDRGLGGHDLVAHEAPDLAQDLAEVVGVHQSVVKTVLVSR